jgi:hypothetical protein
MVTWRLGVLVDRYKVHCTSRSPNLASHLHPNGWQSCSRGRNSPCFPFSKSFQSAQVSRVYACNCIVPHGAVHLVHLCNGDSRTAWGSCGKVENDGLEALYGNQDSKIERDLKSRIRKQLESAHFIRLSCT